MADEAAVKDFLKALSAGLEDMPEEIKSMALPEMLSATKLKSAEFAMECPGCQKKLRKRVQVEVPDYIAWSRAVEMVWNRVYGKPKEAPPPPPPPEEVSDEKIESVVRRVIADMTMEELERIG